MTPIHWLYVSLGVVVYLVGVAISYGMAKHASQLPETGMCFLWPVLLVLEILGQTLLKAFEGFGWLRRALIELGYRWGARLNKGGAA